MLLRQELGFMCGSILGFLDRSISGAMSCFFGCFRVRDDSHHHLRSRPSLAASHSSRPEVVVSQNRLSSLFLDQEKGESPSRDRESPNNGTPTIDKELKNEAKFLKACGTLVETPVEIRKASSKFNASTHPHIDSEPSEYNSWLPNASIKNLQLENQPEQPPTPVQHFEEWQRLPASSEHTPLSYVSNQQSNEIISINSSEGSGIGSVSSVKINANRDENTATPTSPATEVQRRGKSVRFECNFDTASSKGSSSENSTRSVKIAETPGNQSISKYSSYPTPLTLSDEMQTPGTVFPASAGNFPNGKSRIRSQYVYSVPYPVGGFSQWNVLKEEDSNSHGFSGEPSEPLKQSSNATPISEEGRKEFSSGKEFKVESSLSSWLKPVTSTQDDKNLKLGDASGRNQYFGRTPGDRPIIGLVATHWNEDDPTRISPKWWDGNGIPNSTNKYKEDQKVSWHATPFEERLEKALSEESVISQRKPVEGMPIVFDENEESDTALSQLQLSPQPKSVVSY